MWTHGSLVECQTFALQTLAARGFKVLCFAPAVRPSPGTSPTTKSRPRFHQLAPLLKEIAAPISRFDSIGDLVRKRFLGDLARGVRLLGCPIAKG